ncbi:hypothetical protein TNCV_1006801 [Trichonephila clavipes]|nr:hypothetical protein TNCV_1006801 [Trichonephila clavipes]
MNGIQMKYHEIDGLGEVPSTSETDRSHKDSCQVSRVGVPRFPAATVAKGERHCLRHGNDCCHTTRYGDCFAIKMDQSIGCLWKWRCQSELEEWRANLCATNPQSHSDPNKKL